MALFEHPKHIDLQTVLRSGIIYDIYASFATFSIAIDLIL